MKQPKEIYIDASNISDSEIYRLKQDGYKVEIDFDNNTFRAVKR